MVSIEQEISIIFLGLMQVFIKKMEGKYIIFVLHSFAVKVEQSEIHVFVKHYAPVATKSELAIFSTKVKVKVTRSLTLVSFQRATLAEYACQI